MNYLTPDEVAARLRLSRASVVSLARGGGLPHVRIGRAYRFPEEELNAWIADRLAYTPARGEAEGARQRGRNGLPRARSPKAVGSASHRRLDAGGTPDPKGALRVVRAGGEGDAR